MWGTSGDLGKTSAIQDVYDDPKVKKRFGFCAWIRLMHPFNPQEFLRSLVRQFYENSHDLVGEPSFNPQKFLQSLVRQLNENPHDEVGKPEQETSVGAVLAKMDKMDQSDLVHVFNAQLCRNSYLVVINNMSAIEEWHCIKKYFPDNKKQSRIIISTQQVETASLCTEKPYQVSKFKQLSFDQTIYLFHKKNSEEQVNMCSAKPVPDPNEVITAKNTAMPTDEIQKENQGPNSAGEDKACNSAARKKFDLSKTLVLADEVLCGRETEKSIVIKSVVQPDNNQGCKVISVWGMGGLGKTTLVRSIYRSRQLGGWKRAWATALRPFNPEVLLRDLALQLQNTIQEDPTGSTSTRVQTLCLN
ncbi:unnamed protein product [Triticum turgidum subsp. durum]|uniref:NB-ARC domain-containing protein n=1 Tax=Triticum turgidum subsp. durum TaxID=4567 RepID=A0A9R0YE84_TRITD|nr:unnamed protein product [Triticum turgidum subsp. durum]